MGIAERLSPLHKLPESTHKSLDLVFDALGTHAPIDYLISGSNEHPGFFIHPFGDGRFDHIAMNTLGVILGQELEKKFSSIHIYSDPGRNNPESFLFPAFSVEDEQGISILSGIIYPIREYAEQVHETDVLQFESKRWTSLKNRPSLFAEIDAIRRAFPKFEIPHERLQEVLSGR